MADALINSSYLWLVSCRRAIMQCIMFKLDVATLLCLKEILIQNENPE